MNRKLLVLTIILPLTLFGTILSGQVIPRAHAAGSGLTCVAQITDSKCPFPTTPIFNGPVTTPGSLLNVPIFINNTDPFLGFDITVNSSDITKLKPFGVDQTGNIMPTGSITLSECIGGFNVTGAACPATSNPSTLRLAVIGPFGFLSPPGTTGLLFTAIFQIVGTTLPGGIKIDFQSGCTQTSSANKCVTVTNGTITPVVEATQNGGFDNSDTTMLPYATLSTPSTDLGASLAGAPTHNLPSVTYTATSQNGFNTSSTPTLALAVSFNGAGLKPTASLAPSFIDLTGVPRQTFIQSGSVSVNVKSGIYNATVTATYTFQDLITLTTSSLSATHSLAVNVTDFTVTLSTNPVTVQPTIGQPDTLTITPKAGFNTLVKLGVTIPPASASAGIGATFSSYTISGGSGSSTLTVSTTTSTLAGTYTITVTSNSTLSGFTKIHTVVLTIKAGGFTMSATSPSHAAGSFITSTITVQYLNGFTGTVLLTNNTIANLSCGTVTPIPSSVTTNGTATIACKSDVIGSYGLTITGTSGSIVRSTTATFTFQAGVTVSASTPPTQNVGTAETSTLTVSEINGFGGTILLTNNTITNLTCQTIVQTSFTANGTTTVSCLSQVAGTYTLTITARSGLFTATAKANFTFSIQTHDVAAGTITVNPTGQVNIGTKISVTVQVQNKGPANENVTVSLLIGTLTVDSKNVTLTGNQTQPVTLNWDTTGYGANTYNLSVQIQLPAGETNTESNSQVLSKQAGTSTLQSSTTPPLFDTTTLAIIAAVIVAAVLGTLLLLRRRRTTSATAQTGTL